MLTNLRVTGMGKETINFAIKGMKDSGIICLNGPAARLAQVDDLVIVVSYASMDFEEAKKFKPTVIFPDSNNRIANS